MSTDVLTHIPDEDRELVDVDSAQILETVLDLREVPWGDDEYEWVEQ